ncbi:MAG: cyclic pyranopterin monophosphate synthase MoaC [Candidatus Heimdallarchaeota archaeon]|nr:cyclic pyranopterin monophosphate synthase MoaC [Candidatus Heimdallarchaeota archaeon]MDH5645809.1 cyclic pyranopterin monophosphate synthase MoaC [Candidatus Heimdallarchaeota archaeon]
MEIPPSQNDGMVDISRKPVMNRTATAEGSIFLCTEALDAIINKTNPKGDVLENAKLAAIVGAKKTSEMVFMCHPIKINYVHPTFEFIDNGITCRVTVNTHDKTGIEIEAVAAVMNGLLAIFDLSKRYEKKKDGSYNKMKITDIRVIEKRKEGL